MSHRLNSRGDTIVEVMIVIIVMATILASAYAIAVRSLQDTQRTQERAYALKLAEGQLESLKQAVNTTGSNFPSETRGFCFSPGTTNVVFLNNTTPTVDVNVDNYANYGFCASDPSGGSCTSLCYHFATRRMNPTVLGEGSTFTSTVRWDGVGGTKSQVQLVYKVYNP